MPASPVATLVDELIQVAQTLQQTGHVTEAIECLRRCATLAPLRADLHVALGLMLGLASDEAMRCFHKALQADPDCTAALNNLGAMLTDRGRFTEAEAVLKQADSIAPNDAAIVANLGRLRREQGRLGEAETLLRRAVGIRAADPQAWNLLGGALFQSGGISDAVDCFDKALRLDPHYREAASNRAYTRLFLPGITPADIAADHRGWPDVGTPANGLDPSHRAARLPGRPRLGFVSGDFRRHPVGYFTVRALEGIAGQGLADIHCYASQAENDALTARFKACATAWHDVGALSDAALAEMIRRESIDVLFDLTGHNARNRLGVFTLRPAPAQVAWAGYMATTGLPQMDAIVVDEHLAPPDTAGHYSERFLTMPHSFICYDPPSAEDDTLPGRLPWETLGKPTFGCLNMLAKLNDEVIALWATLLQAVPDATLLLKCRELECPVTRHKLFQRFADRGVGNERLDVRGGSDQATHLATFREIDLSLDPFPFSGSTTTLESLWMGVPVLTLARESFASRHSTSFLHALGLTHFIFHDPASWLQRARSLMPAELAALRREIRPRMLASPLCDGRQFARDLMDGLRRLKLLAC